LPTSTPTPGFACTVCVGLVPAQNLGNANCDAKINAIDFGSWKRIYTAAGLIPETEKAAVDFDCQMSNITHKIDLLDFKIWVGGFY